MTHDELLARINHNLKYSTSWYADNDYMEGKDNPFLLALRAVVELHSEYDANILGGPTLCLGCSKMARNFGVEIPYPCPTIQAIEKELG